MQKLTDRRGRRYDLSPLEGFSDDGVAYAAAVLDEARERCIDLIADMTHEAMWTRAGGSPFSAGDLVVHMNWAEFVWLAKIGEHRLPAETVAVIERGKLDHLYEPDQWSMPVGELVELCRRTREDLLIPTLSPVEGLDQPIGTTLAGGRGPKTVGQVIMHVTASWLYHSGQVGLMTMQNGLDYVWAFA
ncbi:MAG: DinB family protein [Spirochaetota bacterium]